MSLLRFKGLDFYYQCKIEDKQLIDKGVDIMSFILFVIVILSDFLWSTLVMGISIKDYISISLTQGKYILLFFLGCVVIYGIFRGIYEIFKRTKKQ